MTATGTRAATPVPTPHGTHRVTNQPPERTGVNEYLDHPVLREAVHAFGGAWGEDRLVEAGAVVGSADFQRAAELANVHEPVLHTHDRRGYRVDEVEYHPAYHDVIGTAVAHGAHTSAWAHAGQAP